VRTRKASNRAVEREAKIMTKAAAKDLSRALNVASKVRLRNNKSVGGVWKEYHKAKLAATKLEDDAMAALRDAIDVALKHDGYKADKRAKHLAERAKERKEKRHPPKPPPHWLDDYPINMTFIVLGCIFLIFGYRFYMPMLFSGGFLLAAVVAIVICEQTGVHLSNAQTIASVSGLVLGIVCCVWYPFGCFILGANWGFVMTLLLNGILISRVCSTNLALWITAPVLALLFGTIVTCDHRHSPSDSAFSRQKLLIFSKTSWVGAYLIMRGVGHLYGGYPDETEFVHLKTLPVRWLHYFGFTVALAVLGTVLQMRFTHYGNCGVLEDAEKTTLTEEEKQVLKAFSEPPPEPSPASISPPPGFVPDETPDESYQERPLPKGKKKGDSCCFPKKTDE